MKTLSQTPVRVEDGSNDDPVLAAQKKKNQAGRDLLSKWLADESGYDERAWPIVKAAIEENRLSDRKRFRD